MTNRFKYIAEHPVAGKLLLAIVVVAFVLLNPSLPSEAQTQDIPVTVSNVSAHQTTNGTVVTIAADSSLSRAQTWQDRDGFHVVVPDAGMSDLVKSGKGVKVRRVGSSIEIILAVNKGTRVSVQTNDNRLNLMVEGKLEAGGDGETVPTQESSQSQVPTYYTGPQSSSLSLSTDPAPANGYPAETSATVRSGTQDAGQNATQPQGALRDAGEYNGQDEGNSPEIAPDNNGLFISAVSGTGVLVVLGIGILGLLVFRRARARRLGQNEETLEADTEEEPNSVSSVENQPRQSPASNGASSRERKAATAQPLTVPTSLYGAYRIDQEVGKLILGQAHRMDVLSSRASDDRRAIEASLIKAINTPTVSSEEKRRAREALEEYGFVARQCAALLLAPEPFDRTSAARSLGEIGCPSALPFLLESLYDGEAIVRNQAVVSIGELKIPSAIGALLDTARKHPDVPSSLVSRALSACSVEGLDFLDSVPRGSLSAGHKESASLDITHLEPASTVEDLPADSNDPEFAEALAGVTSADSNQRTEAVKRLAQYEVQAAVNALVAVARHDPEAIVRSHAIASLSSINHESVFSAVLIGLADDSREVRASSARALSRLSFDRADAYVRVIETSDTETLKDVAEACIKAGIVSQNIDRLASSDHRQAYEAFSLICLLVKAKASMPVVNAIVQHEKLNVRLSAIHLLATTGDLDVLEQLRGLAVRVDLPEELKSALVEGIYKLEQSKPKKVETVEEFVVRQAENEPPVTDPKKASQVDDVGP